MSDLIAEAAAHIAKSADSMPAGRTRDAMLRGEGADDRLSLLVRLTKALEQQRRETQDMKDYGDRAVVKLNKARFTMRDVLAVFTVTTPEELDTLPIGSVIRDDQTLVLERYTSGWRNGWRDPVQNVAHLAYPVRILFTPEEETS